MERRHLTSRESGRALPVNLDLVAFADQLEGYTRLHFAAHGMYLDVREPLADIFPIASLSPRKK